VVVIGYDVWQTRFAGDPDIIGQTVRLGNTAHTVVGVMPEGFAFPVNHGVWVPFREDPSDYARREGPGIYVFGRLGPGVTLEQAQAELTTVGQQMASAFPETHARLRPRIVPYTLQSFDNAEGGMIPVAQLLVILLLVEICVNVAILVYARTATRQGEIAVRSALGASRGRIIAQLFVEALVLAGISAGVGLVVAGLSLRQLRVIFMQLTPGGVPFWMDIGLSTSTVLYVLALTVIAAAITGIVPALKATGRRVQVALQHLSAGGIGMRFGRSWTVLVVAQVAVAVAILPVAVYYAQTYIRYGTANPGFAGGELDDILTATLRMDRDAASAEGESHVREFDPRYGQRVAELVRPLHADPGVSYFTVAQRPPGDEPTNRMEADTVGPGGSMGASHRSATIDRTDQPNPTPVIGTAHGVGIGRVAAGFFGALDVPILMGRRFNTSDLGAASNAVIVNESFVRDVLGGGSAIGRRVRYVSGFRSGGVMRTVAGMELGRWYEIVGVVRDPPNAMDPDRPRAKLYRPLAPGDVYPSTLVVRTRGRDPASFATRLREITAALDPTLQVDDIFPLDEVLRQEQGAMRLTALALTLVTLSILLLSSAGVYALMSFTVAQRRREIAIRSALGADPRRILANIFSRALSQLAIGVVMGAVAAPLLLAIDTPMDGEKAVVLVTVSLLMLAVGLLAAVGPARRGLRIQPTEALKEG
jgi:predicted permease